MRRPPTNAWARLLRGASERRIVGPKQDMSQRGFRERVYLSVRESDSCTGSSASVGSKADHCEVIVVSMPGVVSIISSLSCPSRSSLTAERIVSGIVKPRRGLEGGGKLYISLVDVLSSQVHHLAKRVPSLILSRDTPRFPTRQKV